MSLLKSEEIYNVEGYIWRISEHVYSKYVARKKKDLGVSIDSMQLADIVDTDDDEQAYEEICRLRREIAYLSEKRRNIVYSFYYENKSIADIACELGIPVGTVKWHLNKARNDLKEGFSMERKIGRLGLKPIKAINIGHDGAPGSNGGPEYYLFNDALCLNIVYSVYFTPKTKAEIAEELGVTLVYIEEKIALLENNGFLVRQSGDRYTTYVSFNPETYSLEEEENYIKKKSEIARILVNEYVPKVMKAVENISDIYIPSGNRQLLEMAAIMYGIGNKCRIKIKTDIDKYYIKTTDGGRYITYVHIPSTVSDPDYVKKLEHPTYWACGDMYRSSEKYPVSSWSVDSRYSSREGMWENNLYTDYEYLYEFMTGQLTGNKANENKFKRLRARGYITDDRKVNIMVMKGKDSEWFKLIPALDQSIKDMFAEFALDRAMSRVKEYPSQMQELVIRDRVCGFMDRMVALMVIDLLMENGTFRQLTDAEKVTANLIMFCDILPQ